MNGLGSLAAGFQAVIGLVAANSIFATMQSAAMGGYGVAAVNGVAQAGAAIRTAGWAAAGMTVSSSVVEKVML